MPGDFAAHDSPLGLSGTRRLLDVSLKIALLAYLFLKSDIGTVLIPVPMMSFALAGQTDVNAFLTGFFWVFLHILAFDISNQVVGEHEDRLSKPSRPIPSGQITADDARLLQFAVVLVAILYSWRQGLLVLSVVYLAGSTAYNEGNCARWWYLKSVMGGCGYMCFLFGMITCMAHGQYPSAPTLRVIITTGLIFATTGHAQDFRDREGDAAIGRQTLPMIMPQWLARWSLSALLFMWTTVLIYMWHPPLALCMAVYSLAAVTAASFTKDHSQQADQRSFGWYLVWMSVCHMLFWKTAQDV
ncbi:UbiA prenyltransferase family-domain-containing protein [Schizophyllum amplum]|uniref:UbiA prenyltransferase family-domain-containing protein n=1 Tax=Schizophyllum amplum TaxID=97359 RepID=A0A550CVE2_9AGAR|nr:UbiA prenyltransferase family-domain-containing protein [Auriculariopsis ampla]